MKAIVAGILILASIGAAYGQATAFSGTVMVWPQLKHVKSNGNAVVTEDIGMIVSQAIAFGTNANQMNKWASRAGTLTNSEAVTFGLQGGISNAFGDALTFSRVNFLAVVAPTGNVGNLTIGDAAANPFTGWIGGTNQTVSVRPGGAFVAFAPDATGYAVDTNSVNLKVANSSTNAATYQLYIGGK